MRMKLSELLKGADVISFEGLEDMEVTGVTGDSRKIQPGNAFLCISGTNFDGHKFIESAAKAGAAVAIVEYIPKDCPIPCVVTSDNRFAASWIFSNLHNNPQRDMRIIGVTGTNGKTSTTYMLYNMFRLCGRKCGVIGTICNFWLDKKVDMGMTTPDPERLFEVLAQMRDDGVTDVFMEVSSHSLMLGRVAPLDFEASIYTNLTPEHLDFHKTMEEYAAAKEILFTKSKIGIFCADNEYVKKAAEKGLCKSYTYSAIKDADFVATNVKLDSIKSVSYTLTDKNGKQTDIFCDIGGAFSVYNTLGAVVCALLLGIPEEKIVNALKDIPGVPGRIERVTPQGAPFTAVVDYAHTPDALENILSTVSKSRNEGQKLTVLFGCGGDRDTTKRPVMGKIAVDMADFAIITSDNPRTEDPDKIIEDILAGIPKEKNNYKVIADRREAIAYAVKNAVPDEIILIAGKGHENYEIRKDGKHPFCEKDEVMKALCEREPRFKGDFDAC